MSDDESGRVWPYLLTALVLGGLMFTGTVPATPDMLGDLLDLVPDPSVLQTLPEQGTAILAIALGVIGVGKRFAD